MWTAEHVTGAMLQKKRQSIDFRVDIREKVLSNVKKGGARGRICAGSAEYINLDHNNSLPGHKNLQASPEKVFYVRSE